MITPNSTTPTIVRIAPPSNNSGRSHAAPDDVSVDSQKKPSALKKLMKIAERDIRYYLSTDGNIMVASTDLPHVAFPLSSNFCPPVAQVQVQYQNTYDEPVSTSMVGNLKESIRAHAITEAATPVHIRAARLDNEIWLDTGWSSGEVIRITAAGWEVCMDSPVVFTRSNVMGMLPDPRSVNGDVSALERYVNCSQRDMPLMWAVLITSWCDGAPQPVFSLLGGADSGKSTSMRLLMDLVDPSTTQSGASLPKDPRDFKALAKTRRVLSFDNVSHLDPSQSDYLARISTGGELMSRALYSDDDAHVTQLMRPVWINGIMSGFSRSDLASRSVMIEVEPIEAGSRVSSDELNERWELDRSIIFAGLLNMSSSVLATPKHVKRTGEHRLAEFEQNLAAIDDLYGTTGINQLREQTMSLSETVLNATPLGSVLCRKIEEERGGKLLPIDSDSELLGHFSTQEFMQLVRNRASEEEARKLPNTTKAFGEALMRLKCDLERVMKIRITKKRVRGGRRGWMVEDLIK